MVERQKRPIGRRAVAKGIAWSVPAVALATAAPALAASPNVVIRSQGGACKLPGQSVEGYDQAFLFLVEIENLSNERICITPTTDQVEFSEDATPNGGSATFLNGLPSSGGQLVTQLCLDAPTSSSRSVKSLFLLFNGTGNSGDLSGSVTIGFNFKGMTSNREDVVSVTRYFSGTPPKCSELYEGQVLAKQQVVTPAGADEKPVDEKPAKEETAEDTEAESTESAAAKEPAASDGGGAEPAPSDGGR